MDEIIENIKKNELKTQEMSEYINKYIFQSKKYKSSNLADRNHMYEIYKDRLDYSKYVGNYFEGLEETVNELAKYKFDQIRLSIVDGDKKSCFIFSSEDFNTIIGVIFYNN